MRCRVVLCGAWLLSACPHDDPTVDGSNPALRDRCRETIAHVTIGSWPEPSRPKGPELAAIRKINAMAVEVCAREGLSQTQQRCLLGATAEDQFAATRQCLGDRSAWPSWFSGSGVEVRR